MTPRGVSLLRSMPLSPHRWRELSPYLDEVLEIDLEDRSAWLATIRARDPGVASDLEMLLAEHQAIHDSGFLDGGIVLRSSTQPNLSLSGQTLGAYRLLSLIGQ